MGNLFSQQRAPVYLTLIPDVSARTLVGFGEGTPLRLTGESGETVGVLLDRFNTYRGPTQQIQTVYDTHGVEIPATTRLTTHIYAHVKGAAQK